MSPGAGHRYRCPGNGLLGAVEDSAGGQFGYRVHVPVRVRYDLHERVWSEELPYLFQTVHGGTQRGMSTTTVWCMIRRDCKELAVMHPEFAHVHCAPHDFRSSEEGAETKSAVR